MNVETVKKHISLPFKDYERICRYLTATGNRYTFSSFLRECALKNIEKSEEMDLVQFLIDHCPEASQEEKSEILAMDLNFDRKSFQEVTLNDILAD